jgi:hypothetical protein
MRYCSVWNGFDPHECSLTRYKPDIRASTSEMLDSLFTFLCRKVLRYWWYLRWQFPEQSIRPSIKKAAVLAVTGNQVIACFTTQSMTDERYGTAIPPYFLAERYPGHTITVITKWGSDAA